MQNEMLSQHHQVFIEVATRLSFSEAGRMLFISQPAISKHIKALEEHYKTSLFERSSSGITLTPAGTILITKLKEALNIQKQLEFEISSLNDRFKINGQLKLGASTTVALYILPKLLSAFHHAFPLINIQLLNRNSELITKAMLNDEIDLGIVEGRKKLNSISYKSFLSDRVVAVCSAKSGIATKYKLSLEALKTVPIVLREQGSGTLEVLVHELKKYKIKVSDLNVTVRLGGTEALKNFIREDVALGFLPWRSVMRELESGELIEVKVDKLNISRSFYFIHKQGNEINGVAKEFIRFINTYQK